MISLQWQMITRIWRWSHCKVQKCWIIILYTRNYYYQYKIICQLYINRKRNKNIFLNLSSIFFSLALFSHFAGNLNTITFSCLSLVFAFPFFWNAFLLDVCMPQSLIYFLSLLKCHFLKEDYFATLSKIAHHPFSQVLTFFFF